MGQNGGVELDAFWELIAGSAAAAADREDRAEWLAARLEAMPPEEIVGFDIHLTATRRRAETWTMWAAASRIQAGLCSTDGFWYFLPWLVGLGRTTFERVAGDPDLLADVPEVRRLAGIPLDAWADDDWPEWESLNYLSRSAYDTVTGEDEGIVDALASLGHDYPEDPEPTGEGCDPDDEAEMAGRLPRLSAMFPARAG
jgi:hypothetical protein